MPLLDGLRGTIRVSSFANAEKDGDAGAANFRLWNTPERVIHYRDNTSVAKVRAGNTDIALIASEAPYSAHHYMIAVFNDDIIYNHPDWTDGMFIYDCPQEAQKAYWAIALNSVKELNRQNPDSSAVFLQNASSKVKNFEPGTEINVGRSTYYPHGHAISIDMDTFEPGRPDVPRLQEERDLYAEVSPSFTSTVSRNLKRNGFKNIPLENLCDDYPHGYEFQFDDPLGGDFENFCKFMKQHHEAYTEAMNQVLLTQPGLWDKYWGKNHPFPSYRDFLYYENGKLRYRVCPMLLCPNGALEPAGIELIRDNSIESKFENHEAFKQSLIAAAGRIIDSFEASL